MAEVDHRNDDQPATARARDATSSRALLCASSPGLPPEIDPATDDEPQFEFDYGHSLPADQFGDVIPPVVELIFEQLNANTGSYLPMGELYKQLDTGPTPFNEAVTTLVHFEIVEVHNQLLFTPFNQHIYRSTPVDTGPSAAPFDDLDLESIQNE